MKSIYSHNKQTFNSALFKNNVREKGFLFLQKLHSPNGNLSNHHDLLRVSELLCSPFFQIIKGFIKEEKEKWRILEYN